MEIIGLKGKADVSGVIIGAGTAAVLQEVKGNPLASTRTSRLRLPAVSATAMRADSSDNMHMATSRAITPYISITLPESLHVHRNWWNRCAAASTTPLRADMRVTTTADRCRHGTFSRPSDSIRSMRVRQNMSSGHRSTRRLPFTWQAERIL